MKQAKRLLALLLCAVMIVPCCIFANAASVSMSVATNFNVTSGVSYAKYNVYGSQSGHTEACTVLEFSTDEYLPMPFIANAGSAGLLTTQYSTAVNKYGYEVAGVINGSFFGTADEALIGHVITNGVLTCAHVSDPMEMVTFDANGKMQSVTSTLNTALNVNGTTYINVIHYINKRQDCAWEGAADRIFYFDTSCGTVADTTGTNYEILFNKLDNTNLAIGQSLTGQVVSVKTGNSSTIGSNQFVLSVKTTSAYAAYIKDLKAGDTVTITVNEINASAKAAMTSAVGAITNVGFLVKDGVDLTLTQSSIGTHSVTGTYARWTAFGQKADGSYVFFTSEGGSTGVSSRSLTLRDVAAAMIKLGCVNVIRMDGGGSSAMYVSNTGSGSPGYVQSASRAVCDSILIVKKSSLADANLTAALKTAIADAKAIVAATPNANLSATIAEAEALINSGVVIGAEARRYLQKLSVSGKSGLKSLLDSALALNYSLYTEEALSVLRSHYNKAYNVYSSSDATADEVSAAYKSLNDAMTLTGKKVLSTHKSYTLGGTLHSTFGDDGIRLTNGVKSQSAGGDVKFYSGWDKGAVAEITIDLGSSLYSDTYTVYGAYGFYGISAPQSLKVSVSNDGKNFTSAGTTTVITNVGNGDIIDGEQSKIISLTVKTASFNKARYVKFEVTPTNFIWLDEVEVIASSVNSLQKVGNAVIFNGFNSYVYDSNCFIYTPDFGTLTADKINHRYTKNVILTKTSDPNAYTIKSINFYNGSAPNVTLASNEIMIGCHKGESAASVISDSIFSAAEVGDTVRFYGVDIANKFISACAYAKVESASGDTPDIPDVPDTPTYVPSDPKPFWITHVNDNTTEGAGVIFTQAYEGAAWWLHVAFAPTEESGVYKIVAISNGLSYGDATPLSIPSGGFVWASNYGNNYPELYPDDPTGIDYTSDNCTNAINDAATWTVGMRFSFNGFDPLNPTAPTTTPSTNWYDDAYVCTATYVTYSLAPVDPPVDPPVNPPVSGASGDVNADGAINQYDYILVKRHYFGTRCLTDDEMPRADVNSDGIVNQYDYILIKRHYFGTYTIG